MPRKGSFSPLGGYLAGQGIQVVELGFCQGESHRFHILLGVMRLGRSGYGEHSVTAVGNKPVQRNLRWGSVIADS